VHGPDLYTYFLDNPKLLRSTDGIHPNAQGCVAYRTLWATWAAKTIY
jgi:lysophospholipase L1-like esterase